MFKHKAHIVAWGVVLVCAAGIALALFLAITSRVFGSVLTGNILEVYAFTIYPIVGALIIGNRPENVIGRILAAIGLGTMLTSLSAAYMRFSSAPLGHMTLQASYVDWLGNSLWPVNIGLWTFLVLLFPTGHLPSPRWRWFARVALANVLVSSFASAFMPGRFSGETTINPLGIQALAPVLGVANQVTPPLAAIFILIAIFGGVLARFWRSRGDERQQMKWFAFGVTLGIIAIFINVSVDANSNLGFAIAFALLPISIGISVLRYRLYDIDFIINRALVYGPLSAALATIYFGVVIGVQPIVDRLTGQTNPHPIIIVLTTLLIAALFQPLRQRIQRLIDRRFYRRKFDAAHTLATFGRSLRTEVEMEQLCEHLVNTVEETMQPVHVSLWLRPRATPQPNVGDQRS